MSGLPISDLALAPPSHLVIDLERRERQLARSVWLAPPPLPWSVRHPHATTLLISVPLLAALLALSLMR